MAMLVMRGPKGLSRLKGIETQMQMQNAASFIIKVQKDFPV